MTKLPKGTFIKDLNIRSFYDHTSTPKAGYFRYRYGVEDGVSFYADGSHDGGTIDGLYYRINSDNYFGYEFDPEAEVLAAGCSVTAGIGLYYKWVWPSMWKSVVGASINNIAIPGTPMSVIADSILQYLSEYKKPKSIYVLAPDMFREYVTGIGLDSTSRVQISWDSSVNEYIYMDYEKRKHLPFSARDVFGSLRSYPFDYGLTLFFQSLNRIIKICEVMSIELTVSSWDPVTMYFLSETIPEIIPKKIYAYDMIDYVDKVTISDFSNLHFKSSEDSDQIKRLIQEIMKRSDGYDMLAKASKRALDNIHQGISFQMMFLETFIGRELSSDEIDKVLEKPSYDKEILSAIE